MKEIKDYWYTATERIGVGNYIYIQDGNGKLVQVNGKLKKFKTVTKAAEFIHMIEYQRDFNLIKDKKNLSKEEK